MTASRVIEALIAADDARPRTKAGAGVSSLGDCARKVFHVLRRDKAVNPDVKRLPAILGTAIHAAIETAVAVTGGRHEVPVTVPGIDLKGSADRIDGGAVEDYKTTSLKNLKWIKSHGPSTNQRWQVHVYALAWNAAQDAFEEPDFVDTVRLIFIARDGTEDDVFVWEEPYDERVAFEAIEWFKGVQDAFRFNFEPEPEKPASYCRSWCQFYGQLCPGISSDDDLPVRHDPWTAEAAEEYLTAHEDGKDAEERKAAARTALDGATGVYGGYEVTWRRNGRSTYPVVRRVSGGGSDE